MVRQRVGMANWLPHGQRGRGSGQRVKMVATPCPAGHPRMGRMAIQRGQRVKNWKKGIGGN